MKKDSVAPRKLPVQDRSRKRVALIQDATIRLLEKSGLESITAINVAKEAKIAVASFYQYYPNKESVIFALYQQYLCIVRDRLDCLEKEHLSMLGWREYFELLSKHLLEDPCFSDKADKQIARGMEFYPSLRPLEEEHALTMSLRLARYLKHYGCRWTEDKVRDLGFYLYRTSIELYRISIDGRTMKQQEQFFLWSKEILMNLIADCFDDQT